MLAIDRYAHLVGGCRMGSDPEHSVVDADHRAWEVPNLFIADGSVMPTQGSANPALTIMALASRLAERLVPGRLDAQRSHSATVVRSSTKWSIASFRSASSRARRIADGCVVISTSSARSDSIGRAPVPADPDVGPEQRLRRGRAE